ncbi:MAG: RNA polymerase subunit RPABC4/transcription elongation factor Spt4 [Candidatus Nanohaloarchaea archaeon]|jgi:RNA polymerase subunit RPABC4/transcription elongation factor Spt4
MPDEDESDKSLDRDEKYCKKCGEIIDEEAEICPECGVRQESTESQREVNVNVENNNQSIQRNGENPLEGNKSKTLAGILGIFLGSFGLHKFYLGQPGRGFLFLIFFWTYIPGIIGLIQGISYLLMSEQKFARKFG